jgi:hypothetical protein
MQMTEDGPVMDAARKERLQRWVKLKENDEMNE